MKESISSKSASQPQICEFDDGEEDVPLLAEDIEMLTIRTLLQWSTNHNRTYSSEKRFKE